MRYLKQIEVDEVKQLRQGGMLIRDIAKKFLVCEATVSNIVNGKNPPRKIKTHVARIRNPYEPIDFKEENFSILTDDIFFQHSKEKDFIG